MLPSVPMHRIERRILLLRGKTVMLDRDLADLYEVKTIALRQQVKRNSDRFPSDFMFRLTAAEAKSLVSQSVIPSGRSFGGGHLPLAFTEQGIAMLSSVLQSKRAVAVNISIVRAFCRLREVVGSHQKLVQRIDELEKKFDARFQVVFEAIRSVMNPPAGKRRRIGFRRE